MLLLYFLLWTAVAANKEPLYGKIRGKAVLTPASIENPIKSIGWTHGPNIAMVWFRNGDETFSYRQFKDRGSLNTSTGALTITRLTPEDSGNYTVQINDKLTSKTQLLVISPVSKPTLSVSCEPEMTYCVFTCSGSTTGAEPVSYWWTSGDTTWSSTKEHNITKVEKELWFSCALKNPVSSKSSEKVLNPFIRDRTKLLYCLIPVFILVVCIFCLIYKGRKDVKLTDGRCYQWQLNDGKGWVDTDYNHILEAQYSQPQTRKIIISNTPYGEVCINFNRMRVSEKNLKVRRLDDGNTVWIWYGALSHEWIKDGEEESDPSPEKSSDIEEKFQSNPSSSFTFSKGAETFEIRFTDMQMEGQKGKRRVIRRPLNQNQQAAAAV